jgi:hypothetical protein
MTDRPGGSGIKKSDGLDDLLQRLGIEDDEIDDLIFEEEETAPKQGIKWMALARVHTSNFFSPQTFEQHMKIAWSPAKDIQFHHIEGNLFTIQCHCLGDWLKVDQGGPWLFRQNIVCIEEYDGLTDPETIDLNFFTTWIQIHKLPIGYRKVALIKNLTEKKVGKVVGSVKTNVNGVGNIVRVRVKLDVRKPLARFVTVSRAAQREFYQVKYEKMPRFCGACGLVGHTHLECGSGEYEEDMLKWGDFLKTDWSTWKGRAFGGVRGGAHTGRGGRMQADADIGGGRGELFSGRGRGTHASWRHNALPYFEEKDRVEGELDDTGTSPSKKQDEDMDDRENSDPGAKRRLNLNVLVEDVLTDDQERPAAMAVDGALALPIIPVDDGTNDRTKRSKKDGAISSSLGSAGSREESVRSQ